MRPITVSVSLLTVVIAAAGCAGAPPPPTSAPVSQPTALQTGSTAATASATGTAIATTAATATATRIVSPLPPTAENSPTGYSARPGWILLDHEGNNGLDKVPSIGPDGR